MQSVGKYRASQTMVSSGSRDPTLWYMCICFLVTVIDPPIFVFVSTHCSNVVRCAGKQYTSVNVGLLRHVINS